MTRSIPLAALVTFVLLTGCGSRDEAAVNAANESEAGMMGNAVVEDVPSDGLAAPSDMPLDSESNIGAADSASGGNAS